MKGYQQEAALIPDNRDQAGSLVAAVMNFDPQTVTFAHHVDIPIWVPRP
jgi:hypothetical protein